VRPTIWNYQVSFAGHHGCFRFAGLLTISRNHKMKSSSQIREMKAELTEELDAIVAVTEREERDLSDEEATRCSEITDKLIPTLNKQLKSAFAIEKERNSRMETRMIDKIEETRVESGRVDAGADKNMTRFASIKIPAKAKNYGKLTAFVGEHAERDAYVSGQFILANIFGNQNAARWCNSNGMQVSNLMSSSDNSKGGFFVPDEMSQAIVRLREERGIFPQFANRVPMGSDIIRIPRILTDVTAYWVGENTEITASDPVTGEAELMARKLGALTKVSSELDEDAVIEIGNMITTSMAYAEADKIDDAAFNGDSTSTYGGVLGLKNALDSNAISTALSGNVGASTLDLVDFENAMAILPQYPGASPRWYMNSAVFYSSAFALMNAAGGNTNVTLSNGVPQMMFLGYPVSFVQVMTSTTGSAVSTILAYFGDLRLAASYGVRRSVRTEVSVDRYFELDQIGIKTTQRVAINIHERGDTIRTRPIIGLKTAAT
jgi:HK97 family phage major capsid protein